MHRSRRTFLPFVLSIVLVVGLTAPGNAGAATRAELNAHRQKAETARKQAAAAEALAKRLAGEVEALDAEIEAIQGQADALGPRISTATKRTNALKREVAMLQADAAQLQVDITRTEAELDTQRTLLADRVESTYKQGTWFYLDVLLGSQDIGDLITRTELVSRVLESNSDAAADLGRTKDALSKSKTKLDRSLEREAVKKHEAQAVEDELRGLRRQRQVAANKREAVQDQKSDLMTDSRKNASRLRALAEQEEAESDRIAAELAGGGSGHFAGTMAWPVPSSNRITSSFGPRICPFHGRELHPGIDIGRASPSGASLQGAAIVAAGAGRVLSAGYRGGYGNTVIIDHGNGVTTLYAHQASGGVRVSTGQKVSKGQRIGTVGSTGNSTGPHLHFEVRVNGAPKNPLTYR